MNKMKTIGKWVIPAATALVPFVVFALNAPAPAVTGPAVTLNEIERLIEGIARFLIVVSIVIAVIFIIYGGVRWIAAREDEDAVKNAKAIIKNGIFGALVVLGVGVILQSLAGIVSRSFFGTYQ